MNDWAAIPASNDKIGFLPSCQEHVAHHQAVAEFAPGKYTSLCQFEIDFWPIETV